MRLLLLAWLAALSVAWQHPGPQLPGPFGRFATDFLLFDNSGQPAATLLTGKPAADPRQYQHAKLPNGLEVVNVLEPNATEVSFSLAVASGSFSDPLKLLGLAHLTEHALFLGSKKYPRVAGFDEFLAERGGASNAYTDDEVTVFYASMDAHAFDEGLDRFADIFRDPLLDTDSIWSEVNAVDNEHAKNRQDPQWRMREMMQSLADPMSAMHQFHTGDNQTLRALGKDVLGSELRAYFDENFCPPRMRLVTLGPAELDAQLQAAAARFGDIPGTGRTGRCAAVPPSFASPQPFPQSRLGQYLEVEGTSKTAEMWIFFPLRDVQSCRRSQPVQYLGYLMGHEAEGGLQHVLRDRLGLALGMSVSEGNSSSGMNLWMATELLDQGADKPGAVLDALFAFVQRAREVGAKEDVAKSLADVAGLAWNWSYPKRPAESAPAIAERMTRLAPEELLFADSLITQVSTECVMKVLNQVTPSNMNVGVVYPDSAARWNRTHASVRVDPHYGTKFVQRPLAQAFPTWQGWGRPGRAVAEVANYFELEVDPARALPRAPEAAPDVVLPGAVTTVPENVTMEGAQTASSGTDAISQLWGKVPEAIGDSNGSADELWFRPGWVAAEPRALASVTLRPARARQEASARAVMELEVGVEMLKERMAQRLADSATTASWVVGANSRFLEIFVRSYGPNVAEDVSRTLSAFSKGAGANDSRQTKRLVHVLSQKLNDTSGSPLTMASEDAEVLLMPGSFSNKELLEALTAGGEISSQAAASAVDAARGRRAAATTLVMGSVQKEHAESLHSRLLSGLSSSADGRLAAAEVEKIRRVVRPASPVELRRQNPREKDKNHVTYVSILVGVPTVAQRVLLGLAADILHQTIFADLRTRQQLGYVVGGSISSRSNVLTVSCYVQGDKMQPDAVEAQCERVFAKSMPAALENMTAASLKARKDAYGAILLERPDSIQQEFDHFKSLVLRGGECLDLETKLLKYLDTVTSPSQLAEAWKQAVLPESGDRHKVAVKFWGSGTQVPAPPTPEDVARMTQEAGADSAAAERAKRERSTTQVLSEATSSSRGELVKAGGYFPEEIKCELPATNAKSTSSLLGRFMRKH